MLRQHDSSPVEKCYRRRSKNHATTFKCGYKNINPPSGIYFGGFCFFISKLLPFQPIHFLFLPTQKLSVHPLGECQSLKLKGIFLFTYRQKTERILHLAVAELQQPYSRQNGEVL